MYQPEDGAILCRNIAVFCFVVKMTEKHGKTGGISLCKMLTIPIFRIILFINLGKAKALTEEIYK